VGPKLLILPSEQVIVVKQMVFRRGIRLYYCRVFDWLCTKTNFLPRKKSLIMPSAHIDISAVLCAIRLRPVISIGNRMDAFVIDQSDVYCMVIFSSPVSQIIFF
jgi:hypothetical protein